MVYSFMAAKTINKNSVLLTVMLEDILFLLPFNHWNGGSIWSGAYWCPQKTLKRFSAHPKEVFTSLTILLHLQQRGNAEPPCQHLGQQHTKEKSGHEQKVPFTTSIKSPPCSATFSSSLACLLSLSHQGPYLFHQSPIAPTRSSPRMEYISTNCPCTSHISAMYWASCQSYPPVAFLLAPQAPVGLPHSQFLGLSPGT